MTIEAHIENGQIILPGPLELPDGTKVHVVVAGDRTTEAATENILPLSQRLQKSIGSTDQLPEDASQRLDHYLYGKPKT